MSFTCFIKPSSLQMSRRTDRFGYWPVAKKCGEAVRADSPLWRVMGDPAQAQEAEALAKVRELLPDDGIARAWANIIGGT